VHFSSGFLNSFNAVRNDPNFVLALGVASGIVTFPSMHAAIAILCGWGLWKTRWLRWPSIAANSLMFSSAITHGGHYVIAGGLLAIATILLLSRYLPITHQRPVALDLAELKPNSLA
jgi:membrane-associated phospholipid phosphatase